MSEESPARQSRLMLPGLIPGSDFAGYRVESLIGAGGMGVVFRGYDEVLGRTVALKILAPALSGDSQFRERFIRESRAVAAVDHPHIVPVYAAGEADGMLYLAMRYVTRGDLRGVLERETRLTGDRTIALLSPIASALDVAHADGLVHRDVKPANILIDARSGRPDHPYLSDFGLVKSATASGDLTGTGQFLGTASYAAPEQISGKAARPQTDQYSLACVAYTLLTGIIPFLGDDSLAVLWAHMYDPPPSLVAQCPDQPPAVDEVLARALAKSPEDRYGTCEEFIGALSAVLVASSSPSAEAPPASLPPPGHAETVIDSSSDPSPLLEEPARELNADGDRAPEQGIDPPPRPEPERGSRTRTAAPRPVRAARESGHAVTTGGAASNQAASHQAASHQADRDETSAEDRPEQPAQKRPLKERRGLITAAVAAVVAVVGISTLLATHPWTAPPVLEPAGLAAQSAAADGSGTADSVKISWSRPARGPLPDSYEIFRNRVEIATVLGTETTYTSDGLTPNTDYGFLVIAIRDGKQSPASAVLTTKTPPLTPTGLAAKHETTSSIEIAWSGPAAGPSPDHYEIIRNGSELTSVSGSDTSYTDNGLAPDTAYSYQVLAVSGSRHSQASATLTAARTAKPPLSAAVLSWTGAINEKMTSIYPSESGWHPQPGSSRQDTWTLRPVCSSGPCNATLSGVYEGFTFTAKLTRSGTAYSGTGRLKSFFYCSSRSQDYSATLTIDITVNTAATKADVWTVASFSGHETLYSPHAYTCYSATGHLQIKSK